MHPRLSLHQVAMMGEPTAAFIDHCTALGVAQMTLVTPKLFAEPGAIGAAKAAGPRTSTLNHVFAVHPNIEEESGEGCERMASALAVAAELGAQAIYLITGGRGSLDWEQAAARLAGLLAPARAEAQRLGIRLLVENASALNADIHIAHTLPDVIRLAEIAEIGVCVELHACWMEGNLKPQFRQAMPRIGLVQVSDYVPGDRATPCRAVPGDGVIPLERLLGDLLDAGYEGLFDIELIGPRIEAEGARAASARAAGYLSEMLVRLGV